MPADVQGVVALRDEIMRLLAEALDSERRHAQQLNEAEQRHAAASLRADEAHLADMERRDELHVAETSRRDELHVDELRRREDLHAVDLANLRQALESRDLIGQAKGIVMATMLCSADDAFAILRQQSQHENIKLVDVATEVVRRTTARAQPPSAPSRPSHDATDR